MLFWLATAALSVVAAPVVTLLHEAGHASAALLLTRSRVLMTLGAPDRARPRLTAGRLTVRSEAHLFLGGSVRLLDAPAVPAWRWAAILAAGPAADLVTLALATVLAVRAYAAGDTPVLALTTAVAIGALSSALRNGGRVAAGARHLPSDGEQLARLAGRTPIPPGGDRRPVMRAPFRILTALVIALVLADAVLDPATGVPGLLALLALVGLGLRAR